MSSSDPISTAADVASPAFLDKDNIEGDHASASIRAAMINQPRQVLYDFWRDFSNLPAFTENVKAVEILDGLRSEWTIAGPAGVDIDLTSEITEDIPGDASPGGPVTDRRSIMKDGSPFRTTPSAAARRCGSSSAMIRPPEPWARWSPRCFSASLASRRAGSCVASNN